MQIVVIGTAEAQKEFQEKGIAEGIEVHFETTVAAARNNADAYFYLLEEKELAKDLPALERFKKATFVNAVITTLDKLGENFIRINAWPTFLSRSIIEIATNNETLTEASKVLEAMGWKFKPVEDIAGFIAARVVAMVVNEAYFALEDEVSSKEDIDIAMKLGTNYPFGPFEWSEKIGLTNISGLLTHLAEKDKRYVPSAALLKDITV